MFFDDVSASESVLQDDFDIWLVRHSSLYYFQARVVVDHAAAKARQRKRPRSAVMGKEILAAKHVGLYFGERKTESFHAFWKIAVDAGGVLWTTDKICTK